MLKVFVIIFIPFINCEKTSEMVKRMISEADPKTISITVTNRISDYEKALIRNLDVPLILTSKCVENVGPDFYIFMIEKVEDLQEMICQNSWNPAAKVVVLVDVEDYSFAISVFEVLWTNMAFNSVLVFSSNDSLFLADPFFDENNCGRSVNVLQRRHLRGKRGPCNFTVSTREATPFSGLLGGIEVKFVHLFALKSSLNVNFVQRPSPLNATLEQLSLYYGQLARNEIDLAIGGTAISLGKKNVTFLTPFNKHSMYLYIQKPKAITGWKTLIWMFPFSFWLLLLLSFISIFVFLFFQTKTSLFSLFGILIQQCVNLKLNKLNLKILFSTIYITFFIISSIYVTFIQSYTLKDPVEPSINDLDELISKKYKISSNEYNKKIFSQAKNEVLIERFVGNNALENYDRIFKEKVAILESNYAMEYYTLVKNVQVHKVGPFAFLHVAMVVPKGSIFETKLNYYVRLCLENGLFDKWMSDMRFYNLHRRINEIKRDEKSLDLGDVEGAFYVLVIGLCLSLLVFVFEILYGMTCL